LSEGLKANTSLTYLNLEETEISSEIKKEMGIQ